MKDLTVEEKLAALRRAMYLLMAMVAVALLVMLAVGVSIAIHSSHVASRSAANAVRVDLNQFAAKACKTSSRAFIRKHNSLVNEIVSVRTKQANREQESGDLVAARADRDAAARYRQKRIHVPSDAECEKPILPPKK